MGSTGAVFTAGVGSLQPALAPGVVAAYDRPLFHALHDALLSVPIELVSLIVSYGRERLIYFTHTIMSPQAVAILTRRVRSLAEGTKEAGGGSGGGSEQQISSAVLAHHHIESTDGPLLAVQLSVGHTFVFVLIG